MNIENNELLARVDLILQRISNVETAVDQLLQHRTAKEWYTTTEAAEILSRSEFTVREWCRHGRIRADKKGSGRGKYPAWVIAHDELQRFQREGLLPFKR